MIGDSRFTTAKPALPISNRVSPIKATISRSYIHTALAPIITFYISKRWLNEKFGTDFPKKVSFAYDKESDPPIGMLTFGAIGADLVHCSFQMKANFHAWPSIDADKYRQRSDCPIIEISDSGVVFYVPPNNAMFNANTGKWETGS